MISLCACLDRLQIGCFDIAAVADVIPHQKSGLHQARGFG